MSNSVEHAEQRYCASLLTGAAGLAAFSCSN
jgi:hypothetical protein